MNTIIVQMTEPQWTEEALHLACAMAQRRQSKVTLLHLMPTQHFSWLGANFNTNWLTAEQTELVWRCKEIADSYSVELSVQPMEYISYDGALVEVCEEMEAEVVFAHIPHSLIPLWRKMEVWELRRQLAAHHTALYTLDEPVQTMTSTPQIGAAAAQSHA